MSLVSVPMRNDWVPVASATSTATVDGFPGIVVPPWANEIRLEYDLVPNAAVMWIALLLPNDSTASQASARLISSAIDVIENTRLPLGASQTANRTGFHGAATMDVRAGAAKGFRVEAQTILSAGLGSAQDHLMTEGTYSDVARVSTVGIIGVTNGAAIASSFLTGSTYRLFARR
jgi:hypothetical protein